MAIRTLRSLEFGSLDAHMRRRWVRWRIRKESPVSRARYPLRRYARLVGAANYARSLCSLARLLHALTLQSAYEDTSPLPHSSVTARARSARGGKPVDGFVPQRGRWWSGGECQSQRVGRNELARTNSEAPARFSSPSLSCECP